MSPVRLRIACAALLLLVAGPILLLGWDAVGGMLRIVADPPARGADAVRLLLDEAASLRWHAAALFLIATTAASGVVFLILAAGRRQPDYVSLFDSVAHGDFAKRLRDDGSGFARSWNRAAVMIDTRFAAIAAELEDMTEAVAALREAAEKAAHDSESAQRGMTDASGASDRAARSADSVMTSLPVWETTAREISEAVADAAETAKSGVELAVRAHQRVGSFGKSSREIDGIVESITKIASKTNHLALNATIEAAGAGEAGRGFAIVAGEVKELARRSASATETMRVKIGAFKDEATTAVKDIVDVGTVIRYVDEVQDRIRARITHQERTTEEIVPMARAVAEGSRQASTAITAVDESIRSLGRQSEAALQQAARLEQRLAAVRDLLPPRRRATD